MRILLMAAGLIGLLAACGVDGEPERPTNDTPAAGIAISGSAEVGVAGRF